jgi:exodeoxyribonuclease V alpha subunit
LVLIGDVNQLPPISYGYVFNELLKVKAIERQELTVIKRIEDLTSDHGLFVACERILTAPHPPCKLEGTEHFFLLENDPGQGTCENMIKFLIEHDIDQNDISIITPYRDAAREINQIASALFHPHAECTDPSETFNRVQWRMGDKVIMTVNNHSIDVMNGSSGIIMGMTETHIMVEFRTGRFPFRFKRREDESESDELELPEFDMEDETPVQDLTTKVLQHGYALTVHKAQGNEYDFIIGYIPYVSENSHFINKNMVYTMLSRAKVGAYLIAPHQGGIEVIERQCAYSDKDRRYDFLSQQILNELPPPAYENTEFEIESTSTLT